MITGYEPALSTQAKHNGMWRLAPRRLATLLNTLPPEAISLEAAEAMLRHESFGLRYNAARLLSQRGDRDARLVMQRVLTDGDVPSRASAARHLYGFSWFGAEPLLRQALADNDPRVREGAIYALCDMQDYNAYQMMVSVLQHEADEVRMAAAWGLRDRQDPAAVPVLEMVLRADDPEVRIKALESLGANATPAAIPVVRHALIHDFDADVQYAAALSLLELQEDAAIGDFPQFIMGAWGASRQMILRGFFHATNYLHVNVAEHPAVEDVLDALEVALRDVMRDVRKEAVFPLAWMQHERAANLLRDAYHSETDSEVKAHIMRVAVSLMSSIGERLLAAALEDSDETVRAAAEQVIADRVHGEMIREAA